MSRMLFWAYVCVCRMKREQNVDENLFTLLRHSCSPEVYLKEIRD